MGGGGFGRIFVWAAIGLVCLVLLWPARSSLIASGSAAVFDTVPASGALLIDALH